MMKSIKINTETTEVMEVADKNVKSSTIEMFHILTEKNMNMITSKWKIAIRTGMEPLEMKNRGSKVKTSMHRIN